MGSIRVQLRVRGRVQGVYYRGSTRERAASLGVVGWVRNCRDGSVEIEAEGDEHAVESLVEWCRTGPAGARVDDVEVRRVEPQGATEFVVRY